MIEVKLRLDPRLVWRLEAEAEKHGRKFGEHVAQILVSRTAPPAPSTERQRAIIRLHGEGLNDVQIAAELGCVRGYVTQIRRRFDLPPVGRRKVGA